jgi:hypothetical protein|nr:hypothetical protein [uncultured Lachnoclostridium sp.]
MLSKEAVGVLRHYGITKKDLETAYSKAVKEAKRLWRYGCIQSNLGRGKGRLIVQIGYSDRDGVMYRAYWKDAFVGESADWCNTKKIDLIDPFNSEPFDADDYLYENAYYRRTGCISDNMMRETAKNCPMSYETFDYVAEELAQLLIG